MNKYSPFFIFPKFLLICFIILAANHVLAIDTPKDPIPPVVESVDKKDPSISVKLCDGRFVEGNIDYEKEEIFFHHIKEGIKYEKKLKVTDIKQIKIQSWELRKGKKIKDGTAYQVYPQKIQITTTAGENFSVKGLQDTEFLNLNVANQNGIAKLYTYWLDLLYDNGSWYSKLSSVSGQEREDCHSDVIRVIQFN